MLMTTFAYTTRKFWTKWKADGAMPDLSIINRMFSSMFVQEFGSNEKLDQVMRRAKPLLKMFINTHPKITPILTGASFETPFPIPHPTVIIKDSIDLIYRSARGTENIIVIANSSEHDYSILRAAIAYIGYHSIKNAEPFTIKVFKEKDGFSNIKIRPNHLKELAEASGLVSLLHNSKNKAKHTGLACNACPYKAKCWRGT